jgi:signal peptidase
VNWRRAAQVILTIALLLVVGTFIAQAFPVLVGADHALTVESGSMEPRISTGSVVFVKEVPAERVGEGDIITFRDEGDNFITHRVYEDQSTESRIKFITKGDANANPDGEPVYRSDYVGRLMFDLPYIGYIISFGNTRWGYVTLVLVPVTLLVFNELWELYKTGFSNE